MTIVQLLKTKYKMYLSIKMTLGRERSLKNPILLPKYNLLKQINNLDRDNNT